MDVKQAKQAAHAWVESNCSHWRGLRGAHLVGSVAMLPDDAPFPPTKDVDLHLIFDESSPALTNAGPFLNNLEVEHQGVSIEAGVKSIGDYRSAEAILANLEIAHHLTVDSLLYDPDGLLRGLQAPVRREFARRRWVSARLAHERAGQARALALLPAMRARLGASGEVSILGYANTFLGAALDVAALKPPGGGGRVFVRLRRALAELGRADLHEELLGIMGAADVAPARVEQIVAEGAVAFDLAVELRRTPHPFQHKLHRHLRPYFVESCRSMTAEGHHREAMPWACAFYFGATDVIMVDGSAAEQRRFAAGRADLLQELGMATDAQRSAKAERTRRLAEQVFALADEIAANHPGIVD
jgi:hypothetical protein